MGTVRSVTKASPVDLPPLDVLVGAADAGLHPWVHAHVLVGPRYLGMDPIFRSWVCRPVTAPCVPATRDALAALAKSSFAAFGPGFVLLTTADPIGGWPGTGSELRQVVGLLGDLRARDTPSGLSTTPRADTGFL